MCPLRVDRHVARSTANPLLVLTFFVIVIHGRTLNLLVLRRIFPAIYSVVVASLLAFVALAVLQFNQINSELEREKINILANRVAAPFESAATIGLPLSSVRNTDVLLERARQVDSAIEGALLFSADGTLLASSASARFDATSLGTLVRNGAGSGRTWSGDSADGYFAGVRLFGVDGRLAGAVLLTYSGREGTARSWTIIGKLLSTVLIFAVAGVPLIWFTMRWALRSLAASYDRIDGELREIDHRSWLARHALDPDRAPCSSPSATLAEWFDRAAFAYREAVDEGGPKAPSVLTQPAATDPSASSHEAMWTTPGFRLRLASVLFAYIAAAFMAFSVLVLFAFEQAIEPELQNRAAVVAELIQDEVQRTLELGIPISALGGLSPYVEGILQDFREVSSIAILSGNGEPIAEASREIAWSGPFASTLTTTIGIAAGTADLPILSGSEVVGTIRIEGSEALVHTRVRDVVLDVSILAFAILLIGMEIALAYVNASVWKPYVQLTVLLDEQRRGRFRHVVRERGPEAVRRLAARLNAYARDVVARRCAHRNLPRLLHTSESADIRLPLFFFALGSEVTAAFLPILAGGAARPPWLMADTAAAIPLIVYLICVGLLSPFVSALGRRFGTKSLFLGSVPIAVVALTWMATGESVTEISLARGLVALAYALATVAVQDYALRAEPTASRVTTMSVFVSVILGGTFCGSVIGGVVSSRLGFSAAILLGAVFIVVAAATCILGMRGPAGEPGALQVRRAEGARMEADRPRLFALFVGLAVPLSAVTAAFIWYYVPVYLHAGGQRPADIARVIMLYYLAAILLGPMVGSLGRQIDRTTFLALVGAALAGFSLLILNGQSGPWATSVVVLGVGAGHALLRSPIYALALDLGGASTRAVSILRFLERAGALAGLILAAALSSMGRFGLTGPVLGVVVLGGAILFTVTDVATGRDKKEGHPC